MTRPYIEGRYEKSAWIQFSIEKGISIEVLVSWIPADIAKVGNLVRLKDDLGKWTEGWRIIEVWSRRKGDAVEVAFRDHLHQREVSDR